MAAGVVARSAMMDWVSKIQEMSADLLAGSCSCLFTSLIKVFQ